MRLSQQQASIITTLAKDIFGTDAVIKLFGSRADDSKRGGDIDLFIELQQPFEQPVMASARLEAKLIQALGLQKIDVIVSAPNLAKTPIHDIAAQGIRL
ncbi:MAG: nucleotidyltransferase domain-containing protein [Gammaproteobacteria bacterium]|nr:nucleotidyltransferase domain-containing protein [Gammaproteobacteria bacterium]